MNKKNFLIVERNSSSMEIKKEGSNYILEGIFTQFNTRNNNNRVYESKDFLPHVESLMEKIKANSLLGELDHPNGYEISLKNVSHVIEDLRFDEKKNAIIGRIKLLDTTAGKEAQALVDAGVPLHISSRAAGSVTESGKVRLKKLFTYDLVSEPGFANAVLGRINESVGFNENQNVMFFDLPDNIQLEEKNNTSNMENMVTKEHLDAYTRDWKQQFEELKENVLNANQEDSLIEERFSMLSSTIENLIKHNDSLVDEINKISGTVQNESDKKLIDQLIAHNDTIVEQVNNMEKYLNALVDDLNERFQYVDYVVEESNKRFEYTDYLAEMLNKSIEYSEYLAEGVQNNTKYAEYLAENLNDSIKFSDYLAENLNSSIKYSEYLGENLNNSIEYTEYLAENLDNNIAYSEYLGENLNNSIKYSEHIVENINQNIEKSEIISESAEKVEEKAEKVEKITENVSDFNLSDLDKSLKEILASTKNRKVEESAKVKFLDHLLETQKSRFEGLSDVEKETVISVFENRLFTSPREAQTIFETTLNTNQDPKWITEMPEEYRSTWNSLTESQKDVFKGEAAIRVLESKEQIDRFWKTRDLRKFERPTTLLENKQVANDEKSQPVDERFEMIKNEIYRRFNKF